MKRCFKCGIEKSLSEFYKHSGMKDGSLNKCKECTKKDVISNRRENIQYYRDYDKNRGNRQSLNYVKEYRKNNPDKYKAHIILNNGLRDNKIIKEPCIVCGDIKVHAHHKDYSKPLDVIWLCPAHHSELHHN